MGGELGGDGYAGRGAELTVAGVLLAAGTSTRMGQNKMLLAVDGESLLRRAARRAIEGGLAPVVVVLGHEAERARGEIDDLGCVVVINADYARGVASSLGAGIGAVPAEARAAMVLLADMPFVSAEMVQAMIARYRACEPLLVTSEYGNVGAPPTVFDRRVFDELVDSEGGKSVVLRHRGEAEVMRWPEAALADIDVPDDYANLTTPSAVPRRPRPSTP